MPRSFVVLSIYLENDVLSDPPPFAPQIEYFTHEHTVEQIQPADADRRKQEILEAVKFPYVALRQHGHGLD